LKFFFITVIYNDNQKTKLWPGKEEIIYNTISYLMYSCLWQKFNKFCRISKDIYNHKSDSFKMYITSIQLLNDITDICLKIKKEDICNDVFSVIQELKFLDIPSILVTNLFQQGLRKRFWNGELYKVSFITINILKNLAEYDLLFFQELLGSESYRIEMYHCIDTILLHCTKGVKIEGCSSDLLLVNIINLLGYYCVNCPRNKAIMHWGYPSILTQLTNLEFKYFSDKNLIDVLFPTLIVCCSDVQRNIKILETEMSRMMLIDYLKNLANNDPNKTIYGVEIQKLVTSILNPSE